jgi:hypothetical protein
MSLGICSVLLAGAGALCCVAGRHRDGALVTAMGVLVLAMADTMLPHHRLLPAMVWAVLLGLLAPAVAVSGRSCRQTAQRVAHLFVVALLLGVTAGPAHSTGMPGMSSTHPPLDVLLTSLLATAGYAGLALARSAHGAGQQAERLLGLGSVAAMAATLLAM